VECKEYGVDNCTAFLNVIMGSQRSLNMSNPPFAILLVTRSRYTISSTATSLYEISNNSQGCKYGIVAEREESTRISCDCNQNHAASSARRMQGIGKREEGNKEESCRGSPEVKDGKIDEIQVSEDLSEGFNCLLDVILAERPGKEFTEHFGD
jgi:hypothetical protein